MDMTSLRYQFLAREADNADTDRAPVAAPARGNKNYRVLKAVIKTVVREQAPFMLNKLVHRACSHIVYGTSAITVKTGADGMLRQVCVSTRGKLLGKLDYFVAAHEAGTRRGGHPPSSYLHDLIADKDLDERHKLRIVRQLIAQLPGDAVFGFAISPDARDFGVLKKAFGGAGFQILERATFNYVPPADGDLDDLIASMKSSRIRTALRAARQNLEVIEIPPEDLVRFNTANLEAAGKENYCSPPIDLALLTEAVNRNPPQARIIAARRRTLAPNHSQSSAIESAIAITWGTDGFCKLHRITYRRDAHRDATKRLILEAAAKAAELNKILDTDSATNGGKILYHRFGFTERTSHEFVRYPLRVLIGRGGGRVSRSGPSQRAALM